MAIKVGNIYKCLYCELTDANPSIINDHQKTHDAVLLPVFREDLVKLLQFIFTNYNNRELITERLYNALKKYSKFRINPPDD